MAGRFEEVLGAGRGEPGQRVEGEATLRVEVHQKATNARLWLDFVGDAYRDEVDIDASQEVEVRRGDKGAIRYLAPDGRPQTWISLSVTGDERDSVELEDRGVHATVSGATDMRLMCPNDDCKLTFRLGSSMTGYCPEHKLSLFHGGPRLVGDSST